MPVTVDPYAATNAFYRQQQYSAGQRAEKNQLAQQQIDNERNRLRDMYVGNQEQRAQAQFEDQQGNSQRARQLENARILHDAANSVVNSQDPVAQTRSLFPQLQALGIQGLDLNSLNGANPEEIRKMAAQVRDGLAPFLSQTQNATVQSTFQGKNGNAWTIMRDGKAVDTGIPMQKFSPVARDIGGGIQVFDPNDPTGSRAVLSTPEAQRNAAAAEAAVTAGAGQNAKDQTVRNSGYIDAGIQAADALSITKRGLELLDEVKTGGVNNVALKVSNLFGVTGANEAELSANLGKAVLSQLRSTFGAAFTEKEGARLAEIEAGFGKSTEGNRRLLEQAQKILDRAARRGLDAAQRAGDTFSADEIRKSMNFTLSTNPQGNGWGKAVEH